jgi:hydroxyethylthiazole kinase-like uncharacterized protein yjeF
MMAVSGEAWNTGAARLAARGGLRVGAGVVTVLSPPNALAVNAAHLEAVMLAPFESEFDLQTRAGKADAVVIGPAAGVGEATMRHVFALARNGAALVVDADALTSFADDPAALFSALDRDDVLTPHPGEFERIFPGLLAASPERITAAREAARRAGAVVLLKGPDTVVAAPDGRAAVSLNGAPWLATAGAGDVLAGFIAGLIAQGMESFEAACAAAWIHAEAGAAHGPGLIAEDLPDLAPSCCESCGTPESGFSGPGGSGRPGCGRPVEQGVADGQGRLERSFLDGVDEQDPGAVPHGPALFAFDDFDGFHGARSLREARTQTRPGQIVPRQCFERGNTGPGVSRGGMARAGVDPGRC